jgi:hypothetical protein
VNIELLRAKPQDTPTLRRLMQLYLYDLGSLDDWHIVDNGIHGNPQSNRKETK